MKSSVSGLRDMAKFEIDEIWKDTSCLDLLNEVVNYEIVSVCTVWTTGIIRIVGKGDYSRLEMHPRMTELPSLDNSLTDMITLMDKTGNKLEQLEKMNLLFTAVFSYYERSVYNSL